MSRNNLEHAISLFFEHGAVSSSVAQPNTKHSSLAPTPLPDEDDVRAPINVHKQERIMNSFAQPSGPVIRKKPKIFSDNSALGESFKAGSKLSCDLSFDDALQLGLDEKKWMVLHIHEESSFDSLRVSRDVWPDETVSMLLNESFILWLRPDYHPHVRELTTKYPKVLEAPYIAIIDCRTGRVAKQINNLKCILNEQECSAMLMDFLEAHNLNASNVSVKAPPVSFSSSALSPQTSPLTHPQPAIIKPSEDQSISAEQAANCIASSPTTASPLPFNPIECTPPASDLLKGETNCIMRLTLLNGQRLALHVGKDKKVNELLEFACNLNGFKLFMNFDVCLMGLVNGGTSNSLRNMADTLVGNTDFDGASLMSVRSDK